MSDKFGRPALNIGKKIPQVSGGMTLLDIGVFDGSLPFYGVEKISLGRETTWDVTPAGPQSVAISAWNGSLPLEYEFNFELVAGYTVADRSALLDKMRIAHAMVSHQFKGGIVTGPPAVLLTLGEYINVVGVVKRINCIGNPPFDDEFRPTSVTFQGQFTALPGYKGKKGIVQVSRNNDFLSFESVMENFYNRSNTRALDTLKDSISNVFTADGTVSPRAQPSTGQGTVLRP